MSRWIDMRKKKPPKGDWVIVCDEYGVIEIEQAVGYVNFEGHKFTFLQGWKHGNGTRLVAWQPLPPWPKKLCREDADGMWP